MRRRALLILVMGLLMAPALPGAAEASDSVWTANYERILATFDPGVVVSVRGPDGTDRLGPGEAAARLADIAGSVDLGPGATPDGGGFPLVSERILLIETYFGVGNPTNACTPPLVGGGGHATGTMPNPLPDGPLPMRGPWTGLAHSTVSMHGEATAYDVMDGTSFTYSSHILYVGASDFACALQKLGAVTVIHNFVVLIPGAVDSASYLGPLLP